MGKSLRELPVALLRSISDGFERLFSALLSPLRGRGEEDDDERGRPWWHWLWLIPGVLIYWLYRVGLATITFPVRAWFLPREQRNCYLRGLPALLVSVLVLIAIATYLFLQDRIMIRYANKANWSYSNNEPSTGIRYARRILTESSERRQLNTYLYALLLARGGDEPRANQALAAIAPDDQIGFRLAHQLRAGELVSQLAKSPDEETLDRLRWHLDQSGNDKNEQLLILWARYHQATGEMEQSAAELKEAGRKNPVHFLNLWDLEERRGNAKGAAQALEDAREGFSELLNANPLMKIARLNLALTLTKQNRMQEAERVLLAGLQMHRDLDMQNAVADFYVLRFDATTDATPVIERLGLLTRALSANLNNRALYERWVKLFSRDLTHDEIKNIRNLLEELLVSGGNPAIAHFGLGFLNLLDSTTGDQGTWHLKQSITLQPLIALACNNMATVLMQQEPPRLEEALELARQAVAANPKTASFHETLGTVLLARREWAEAAQELNDALEASNTPKTIHLKLAQAYEGLGQTENSQRHRDMANSD